MCEALSHVKSDESVNRSRFIVPTSHSLMGRIAQSFRRPGPQRSAAYLLCPLLRRHLRKQGTTEQKADLQQQHHKSKGRGTGDRLPQARQGNPGRGPVWHGRGPTKTLGVQPIQAISWRCQESRSEAGCSKAGGNHQARGAITTPRHRQAREGGRARGATATPREGRATATPRHRPAGGQAS